MLLFILSALAIALAAVLWYTQAADERREPPPQAAAPSRQRYQELAENAHVTESLTEAIRTLETVMEHPELGGPGYLLVQVLPRTAAGGSIVVTAQYPNIREGLYRRIIRRELDRDELIAASVPEAILSGNPEFEAESGGVVLVSLRIDGIPPEMEEALNSRKERNTLLEALADLLRKEFPQFSVRALGAELLLSPIRSSAEAEESSAAYLHK